MVEQTSMNASLESLQPAIEVEKAANELDTTVKPGKKKKKNKGPGSIRGIETMFRVSYENNIQLSKLADNKANTLIGINGMIISVIIALVTPRIEVDSWLMAPSVILLLGCLSSLTLAIMASRPRLIHSDIDLERVLNNDANILFFGNFTQLDISEFQKGMDYLMNDHRLLYDNMIREIYFMGKVLTRKYYFLRYAYTAFLATLALSVMIFVTVFYLMGN